MNLDTNYMCNDSRPIHSLRFPLPPRPNPHSSNGKEELFCRFIHPLRVIGIDRCWSGSGWRADHSSLEEASAPGGSPYVRKDRAGFVCWKLTYKYKLIRSTRGTSFTHRNVPYATQRNQKCSNYVVALKTHRLLMSDANDYWITLTAAGVLMGSHELPLLMRIAIIYMRVNEWLGHLAWI